MTHPYRYHSQWPIIAKRINQLKILPARSNEFRNYAQFAINNKNEYLAIEKATNVPWPMIAVIHRREGNGNFGTYLGNGQSLHARTSIVPVGRGPFDSFLAGALDAIHIEHLDKVVPPWPVEKILYWLEPYNGLGYFERGIPSPYIWGGTTVQMRGKYVADGVFDQNAWDTQPGCAAILWMIGYLDTDVHYTRES